MITLVLGTQDSGKSALAEKLALETKDSQRIYLATMKVCDDAGKERVARHRKQRMGKGFETIELLYNIGDVLERIDDPQNTTLLLECVSNLVGNEIYDNPKGRGMQYFLSEEDAISKERDASVDDAKILARKEAFADMIAADIKKISEGVNNLIVVANEYEAGDDCDDETKVYVQLLNMVNDRISAFSDKIYDVRKGAGGEDI